MRRPALAALAALLMTASTMVGTSLAADGEIYEMYFPLVGGGTPNDDFGDPRGDHTHEGNDIMADKMTEVLAVASGTVGWVSDTCCAFQLIHEDGWESWYIHLNNDTPGTDDGLGWGMVDGIVEGATVIAGQLVGWVGDSGNAEEAGSHLHFELHSPPDGLAIDPYQHLLAATVLDAPIEPGEGTPPTTTTVPAPEFFDISGSVHAEAVIWLASQGITKGCTTDGTSFCPDDPVTREQMASFLVRAMGYQEGAGTDLFWDDDDSSHEANIERLANAGITTGCDVADPGRYCPTEPVVRGQMASFLVRAMGYDDPGAGNLFVDDDGSPHEASIDRLATAGVTQGCEPGLFCPDDPVTRAQMASFLFRALAEPATDPYQFGPTPWEAVAQD